MRAPITRPLAILAIIFAGVALTGCSLLGDIAGEPAPSEDGSTTTDVFTITVGDCMNDGDVDGEVSEVAVIDCASAHDSEAFESVIIPDGDFPGEAAVGDQAVSDCTEAFSDFIGLDYDSSTLNFSYYFPTEESWSSGDREILCIAYDPDGRTTGTLEGAAR